jgi:GNAT superfamily N-acetyltransferase
MEDFLIEKVETLEDWRRAVAVRNRYMPDGPSTAERSMNFAASLPPHVKVARFLVSQAGQDLMYGAVEQAYWTPKDGLYSCHLMSVPELDDVSAGIDEAERLAMGFGATEISFWHRTDRPALGRALQVRGYQETQRNTAARIDLSTFDPKPWLEARDRVLASGYEIVNVLEYSRAHPSDWKRALWRMEMDIFQDVPLPEPFVEVGFEDWVRELEANEFKFEWQFFALWEGAPIGLTQLFPNFVDSSLFNTGLTGVLREHRRKGVARALKAHAFSLAKDHGVERVFLDNEENNPMYLLNLALGVQPDHDIVNSTKVMG